MARTKLDSSKVLQFAQKEKRFTTADVVKRFRTSPGQAAAAIAILRIKEVLERDQPGKDDDGHSRWVFTG